MILRTARLRSTPWSKPPKSLPAFGVVSYRGPAAGCTVNLVQVDRAQEFAEAVRTIYCRKTGVVPEVHVCRAADGAFGRDLVPSGS